MIPEYCLAHNWTMHHDQEIEGQIEADKKLQEKLILEDFGPSTVGRVRFCHHEDEESNHYGDGSRDGDGDCYGDGDHDDNDGDYGDHDSLH